MTRQDHRIVDMRLTHPHSGAGLQVNHPFLSARTHRYCRATRWILKMNKDWARLLKSVDARKRLRNRQVDRSRKFRRLFAEFFSERGSLKIEAFLKRYLGDVARRMASRKHPARD